MSQSVPAYSAENPGVELYDFHCHLDFAAPGGLLPLLVPDRTSDVCDAAWVAGALSCTVTPRDYLDFTHALHAHAHGEAAAQAAPDSMGPAPRIRVGAGLHPWWLADGRCGAPDVELLENLITGRFDGHERCFVGEIGLDFAPRRAETADAQARAFDRIIRACVGGSQRRIISIHAVRSAGAVLDILEKHHAAQANTCILHWFSGNSDELNRAVRMGCFFSLGTRMLATRRGRAYARAIPPERLLLETDLPDGPGIPLDSTIWADDLRNALALLEQATGRPIDGVVAQTSRRLLGLPA